MMMRIRTVKPELLLHDKLFELERSSKLPMRLSYIGLFMAADREGRFKWEPKRLQVMILPWDGIDFASVLDGLLTGGFIVKYRVKDQWYGWIPTFKDHQQINNREMDSTLPEVETADEVINACSARGARVGHASQGEQNRIELNRTEQNTLPSQKAAKAKTSKNPDPMKYGFNIGGMFVAAYKKYGRGDDYRIDGPDQGALKSLYKTFRPGEMKLVQKCIELYLYDTSKFLQDLRWKLEYMPKHVNKYIAQAKAKTQPEVNHAKISDSNDPYNTIAGEFNASNGTATSA